MEHDNDKTVARGRSMFSPGSPGKDDATLTGSPNVLPVGTRLGEFEITGLIGEGGFGIVYMAYDHSLERRVALKEYMPSGLASRTRTQLVTVKSQHFIDTFKAGLRSFVNEARLLAQFDSPSLVKVYRFWEANGTAYMVMPFYEGVTLKQAFKERTIIPTEDWIRSFLANLCDAIETIHRVQCYHRDIAPDNILLLRNGRPLLLDFGAARRVIGDRTQGPTVILKPGFAPIEQYADMPGLRQGPWTDIYALAGVVYYLITGKAPPQAIARIVNDAMVPPRVAGKGRYGEPFLDALEHALAIRPDQRIQSVDDFRHEFDLGSDVPRTLPPLLSKVPRTRTGGREVPPTSARQQRTSPLNSPRNARPDYRQPEREWTQTMVADNRRFERPGRRSSKPAWAALGLVLSAGIATGVYLGFQGGDGQPAEQTAALAPAEQEMPPVADATEPVPRESPQRVAPAPPAQQMPVTPPAPAPLAPATAKGVTPTTDPGPEAEPAPAPPVAGLAPSEKQGVPPAPLEPESQGASSTLPKADVPGRPSPPSTPRLSPEEDLWKLARSSNHAGGYETYLKAYPDGRYAVAARQALDALRPRIAQSEQQANVPDTGPVPPFASSGAGSSAPGAASGRGTADPPIASAERNSRGEAQPNATPSEQGPSLIKQSAGRQAEASSGTPAAPSDANAESTRREFKPQEPARQEPATPPYATSKTSDNAADQAVASLSRQPGAESGPKAIPPAPQEASPAPPGTLKVDGQTLTGNFTVDPATGVVSGKGRIVWSNGDQFEGTLVRGSKEGKGVFIWSNGQRYVGEWARDKPNGRGVITFANGNRYEGDIKDGVPSGKGVTTFGNGNRYEGDMRGGLPDGKGVITFSNGNRYEGDVRDGVPTGKGLIVYSNNDRYEGDVRDGLPHGQGVTRFKDGDVYDGAWVRGKSHGQGRYTWANGSYWEGEFREDKQTENGTMVFASKAGGR